jgi:hypothetical protein
MTMKTITSALLGLAVLIGAAVPVSAADCVFSGRWKEGAPSYPIFDCPQSINR